MSKAMYKCPDCGDIKAVRFRAGEKPKTPKCNKCNKEMERQFVSIEIGDVVKDEMLELGQKMLYE